MTPRYYLMRLVRHGPLVPARQQWLDHEPGELSNKRDRGGLLELVDIAGEVRPPEELHERLHWPRGHWKFCQPIAEAEYHYLLERLRWAEENEPDDPALAPRRRIDPRQGTLPSFERENAHVRS